MFRIGYAILFLFILLAAPVLSEDTASGGETENILFYEVYPFGDHEGISLFNYGSKDTNLKGWSVSDGEGTLTFVKDIYVKSGTRLTVAKTIGADDWFSGRDRTIAFDDKSIERKGSFILANTGDDVYLYRSGATVDAVCYGNKRTEVGWKGDPADLPSNRYLLRIGSSDTDTLSDWVSTKPGLTNRTFDPELFFDAKVTPFSFPESRGIPIFKELESAEHEILISMYLLTNVQLAALLCESASEKNVTVRILLEGDVLGYDMTTELTLMRSIVDAGGEVYLINDQVPGNYERFSFFHNKYAVIDGKKMIVTSENWTSGNLSSNGSNRGWGAVIESEGLAEYVRDVFLSDLSLEHGDVRSLLNSYPGLKPYQGVITYGGAEPYEAVAFDARVMPVLSPDNSWSALRYFVEKAETRVYSQQLDLGNSYQIIADRSPLGWMSSAADRGVDARFILDSSSGSKGEAINLINSTTEIKAISVDGRESFSLIHNKGVVIDDLVWVGSVNWTETSFMNNREFAVVVDSPEVTEFFAGLFIEDWGVNEHTIEETGLEITFDVFSANGRSVYAFTVSGPEHSEYVWDVLGNGVLRTSSINRIALTDLPSGTYRISVTMDGTGHSAASEYTVASDEKQPAKNNHYLAVAAAGLAAAAGAGIMIRRRRDTTPL
ncbi:MAG: phospholipase D-like domain-containing protein [Methanomassiliicoccaceae archaeon]|nr:phospholipase D-like domain-containing protein [Methanomassiliicoccaceae archaeon]